MTQLYLELRCIQASRPNAAGLSVPHGYILPNGVVVVWQNGSASNSIATVEQARTNFPGLVILGFENQLVEVSRPNEDGAAI